MKAFWCDLSYLGCDRLVSKQFQTPPTNKFNPLDLHQGICAVHFKWPPPSVITPSGLSCRLDEENWERETEVLPPVCTLEDFLSNSDTLTDSQGNIWLCPKKGRRKRCFLLCSLKCPTKAACESTSVSPLGFRSVWSGGCLRSTSWECVPSAVIYSSDMEVMHWNELLPASDNPKVIELMCSIYLITKNCRLLAAVQSGDHIQQAVQTLHQYCHKVKQLRSGCRPA